MPDHCQSLQGAAAVIAPYPELAQLARQTCKDLGLNLPVHIGDLSAGVQAAQTAISEGVRVIISRGGTARLIRLTLEVPVVEIPVTEYDILRAIYQIRHCQEPMAAIGFSNVIQRCHAIAEVLEISLGEILINSEEEAAQRVAEAARQGIRLVVGDAVSSRCARLHGLKYQRIDSGQDALITALEETQRVLENYRQEQEKAEQLRAILSSAQEGILAVDKNGQITVFNPAASKILGLPASDVLGRRAEEAIPGSHLDQVLATGQPELGKLQQVGTTYIAANRMPVIVQGHVTGAISTFQEVSRRPTVDQKRRGKLAAKGLEARYTLQDVQGQSQSIRTAVAKAQRFALLDSTVLIMGESGTGKEIFAQGIHNASRRRTGPFVALNCATIPEQLFESELFGYEAGAFTGAKKGGKPGLFELANGGTLFLDEAGELPLPIQAHLLRVLEERQVMRLGGDRMISVDVRIIAATNRDLYQEAYKGRFRMDLLYRLDVLELWIPPLRERTDDLRDLVPHFLAEFRRSLNKEVTDLTPEAMEAVMHYAWPGNVRELRNVLERAATAASGPLIRIEDLALRTPETAPGASENGAQTMGVPTGTLREIEQQIIEQVLAEEQFHYGRAAKRLGLNRSTLWRRLQKPD